MCILSNLILYPLGLAGLIKTNVVLDNQVREDGIYLIENEYMSSPNSKYYKVDYKEKGYDVYYFRYMTFLIPFFSLFVFITDRHVDNEIEFYTKENFPWIGI